MRGPHGHRDHHRGRFEGGFASGRGFRSGRKLGSADLQLVLLALLGREPRHGYELIREIEAHSGGFYVPSPGMIYPALTYLDEIGYTTNEADGTKKLYTLTDAGRAFLAENQERADRILEDLAAIGAKMDQVRDVFEGRGHRGEDGEHDRGPIHAARHALRQALHDKRGCDTEEAERVAGILARAAEEISKG